MKLVFEGFVDYGEDNKLDGTIKDQTHKGELADHAFVFIFRPYRCNWIQPIACYATMRSCSGSVIQQLMARAICALHQQFNMVLLLNQWYVMEPRAISFFIFCFIRAYGKFSKK